MFCIVTLLDDVCIYVLNYVYIYHLSNCNLVSIEIIKMSWVSKCRSVISSNLHDKQCTAWCSLLEVCYRKTESSHPDESDLFFSLPQFPLCSWAISYTVHCAFVWLFFLFISLYLIQFIIQGPFVPPLSGHTKHSTQYGWGFFHVLSSSPLGCGIRKEYLEQAFSFCAQEARKHQEGKAGEAPSWRINAFERHSYQRQNFCWVP